MPKWTRRDLLKSSVAAAASAPGIPLGGAVARDAATRGRASSTGAAEIASSRERLLLDLGWRFHLGHADDPARDFDYGLAIGYMKTGEFFLPAQPAFDDTSWGAIDLPHDWGVELPFVQDQDAPGATAYRTQIASLLHGYPVESVLHDKIIANIGETGSQFHVLVLKTTMAIPYTSVFIRLDCKYWSADAEKRMRQKMSAAQPSAAH